METKLCSNNSLPCCVLHWVQNIEKSTSQKTASEWRTRTEYATSFEVVMMISFVQMVWLTHCIPHLRIQSQYLILQVVLIETAISLVKRQYTIHSTGVVKWISLFRIHRQRRQKKASFKANQSYLTYSVTAYGFPKLANV